MNSSLETAIALHQFRNPSPSQRASLAAIEIEISMREGRLGPHANVIALAKELEEFSRKEPDAFSLKGLTYANLFWPNYEDWRGKTAGELEVQINLFSKELRCFEELDEEKQRELINYCIRLSKLEQANDNSYRRRLVA
jgi:hypothetical protein